MLACPTCKRAVFTRQDLVLATLDGTAQCSACGALVRLDLLSRWLMSCVVAIVLSTVLMYAGVLYSGHLFLVSMFVIFGTWGVVCAAAFRFLTLEKVAGSAPIGVKNSILVLCALLIAAVIVDGLISSRFETDEAYEGGRPPSTVRQQNSR